MSDDTVLITGTNDAVIVVVGANDVLMLSGDDYSAALGSVELLL